MPTFKAWLSLDYVEKEIWNSVGSGFVFYNKIYGN